MRSESHEGRWSVAGHAYEFAEHDGCAAWRLSGKWDSVCCYSSNRWHPELIGIYPRSVTCVACLGMIRRVEVRS